MTLRLVPSLDEQTIGHNPDTGNIVVVQRWSGFPGNRHATIIIGFSAGGVRAVPREQMATASTILIRFRCASTSVNSRIITETRARELLTDLGHPAEERCTEPHCRARLPFGGRWCISCGRPYHIPNDDGHRSRARTS